MFDADFAAVLPDDFGDLHGKFVKAYPIFAACQIQKRSQMKLSVTDMGKDRRRRLVALQRLLNAGQARRAISREGPTGLR